MENSGKAGDSPPSTPRLIYIYIYIYLVRNTYRHIKSFSVIQPWKTPKGLSDDAPACNISDKLCGRKPFLLDGKLEYSIPFGSVDQTVASGDLGNGDRVVQADWTEFGFALGSLFVLDMLMAGYIILGREKLMILCILI